MIGFNQGFRKLTKTQRKLERANQKRVVCRDHEEAHFDDKKDFWLACATYEPKYVWVAKPATHRDMMFQRGHTNMLNLLKRAQ